MRLVALILIAILAARVGQDDRPPKPDASPPATPPMIPDPDWTPAVGQEVVIDRDKAPAASHRHVMAEYDKLAGASDRAGIEAMLGARSIVPLPRGTKILILDTGVEAKPPGRPRAFDSGSPLASSLIGAGLAQRAALENPPPAPPLEVRVLDGPLKGQARFVRVADAARMIPKPPDPPSFAVGEVAVVMVASHLATTTGRKAATIRLPVGTRLVILAPGREQCRAKGAPGSGLANRAGTVRTADLARAEEEAAGPPNPAGKAGPK